MWAVTISDSQALVVMSLAQAAIAILALAAIKTAKSLRDRLDEMASQLEIMASRRSDRPRVLAAVNELKSILEENRPEPGSSVVDGETLPVVPVVGRREKYGPVP